MFPLEKKLEYLKIPELGIPELGCLRNLKYPGIFGCEKSYRFRGLSRILLFYIREPSYITVSYMLLYYCELYAYSYKV